MKILMINDVAAAAGFQPGPDGKLALPNDQTTADALAYAALQLVTGGGSWQPGQPPVPEVTLSGPGPVWAYLSIAHALHGSVPRLVYASPIAEIEIFSHSSQ